MINFFKRRKYRAVQFGEPQTSWTDGTSTTFSVIFYENDNGKRKYSVTGARRGESFNNTSHYAPCETWKRIGLLPKWAKDPLAEKLSR